ncbi:putative methylsterol monooxygenase [Nymphaea thermarum]|nr:putative methylsterol monooxygenase [Nymphaea thermarum]
MLPFSSLEEAAASLGRPLTHAETLWFRYSATMPDYFIYFIIFFLFFLFMVLCSLPLALIEAMSPKLVNKFKIQPNVRIPFSRVLQCYKDVFIIQLIAITPIESTFIPFFKLIGIRTSLPLPSLWPEVAVQLLVYVLVEDYGVYWVHRLMHSPWAYDKFHRVHHEYTAPVGICTNYGHWVDILILALPTVAGPAIAPCHVLTFTAWLFLRQFQAVESHCGHDFPWSPNKFIPFYGGAEYHDYHHYVGKSQCNLASTFTYCDYIYGTYKVNQSTGHQNSPTLSWVIGTEKHA